MEEEFDYMKYIELRRGFNLLKNMLVPSMYDELFEYASKLETIRKIESFDGLNNKKYDLNKFNYLYEELLSIR